MADTTNTTTVHTVEVVRYDDPVIITERVAVSAFLAGYTDPRCRPPRQVSTTHSPAHSYD